MKKTVFCIMILLSVSFLTSCGPAGHYSDPFYNFYQNYKDDEYAPAVRLPIIKPITATRDRSSSPWDLGIGNTTIWIQIPNSDAEYPYSSVVELEKFSVQNGVIMAYSSYVDKQANAYIQNNYYHWFVIVPGKNITKGFQAEDEFDQYIQTLGIQNPDWQTPDEAFDKYFQTGCLDWIPDCK
ncbi:MAG: hypothetical protein HYR70_04390 [Chloroflexi bacterium]|nr:hypothetical protein [Chloroflexota bacterium]MBI3340795.1 hypothetical protein [Chloroflexota bacterium]